VSENFVVLNLCTLSIKLITTIITDSGECRTAASISSKNVLWVWCCIHLLSLVFQDSFSLFPQNKQEGKAHVFVMLRKIVNLFIIYLDKLKPCLIPEGCRKYKYKIAV
jgi:hypothetical protein